MFAKRLNLVLPERTISRLNSVRVATLASSVTDVIRTALLTYQALVEFAQQDYRFYVKRPGEDAYVPVRFLFDVAPVKPPESA